MTVPLKAVQGLKIRAGDGWEEAGFPEMMSTSHFYFAEPGDRIVLLDGRYKFNIATYTANVEEKWIYTYAYQPNQAWVVYNRDLSGDSYKKDDYIFQGETYFRICLRKINGENFNGEDINNIISFEKRDVLRFALLTDTHYVVNGTWEATAGSIWAANRRQKFDGIIHLGDITDGMLSKDICEHYAGIVLDDLRATGAPVWVTIGNHDSNYFRGNKERLTLAEQCKLYLGRNEPRYFVDFDAHKLRLLFLDSYEPDHELRYGYSPACISWVERTLTEMPKNWNAVVFSHVTPIARLQVWVKQIRGQAELLRVLNQHAGSVLAFVNGHQHADLLHNDEKIPFITIGCAKCEYETVHKPETAVTPERALGDATQDLWDILTVDTAARTLRFKRRGAGKDRLVKDGKAQWL
jgi:hypothetical protein